MIFVASACAWTAIGCAWYVLPTRRPVRARSHVEDTARASTRAERVASWGPALAASMLVLAIVGWPIGVPLAAGAGWWLHRRALRRLTATDPLENNHVENHELALAAVLLATALEAGIPVRAAVEAVGTTLDGRTGERLIRVAADAAVGVPADEAWKRFAKAPSAARFASMVAAADRGGLPPVDALRGFAATLRASAAALQAEEAHRASIRAVLPMGLCFLPAFVLVGIVPVAAGAFGELGL